MAPTPSPISETTDSKEKPNNNSNDDFDIDAFDEKQPSKKRSQLVRTSSVKSLSTRSSTSSIQSTTSNTSQSSKVKGRKKKSLKLQKGKLLNGTEEQSPVHVDQKAMGQSQSQTETITGEKSDEKNQLETTDIVTFISDSSSDDRKNTGKNIILGENFNNSRVVLTRVDELTVPSCSDNMKTKNSKRKTPEDGFGENKVIAKRPAMSRKSIKSSPLQTEMTSSNTVEHLSIVESTPLSLDIDDNDAFLTAMNDLKSVDCDLEESLFTDLERFDRLPLTADEETGFSVFEPCENPTQNVEMIEQDYQGTSNMVSSSEAAKPSDGHPDEWISESDPESDDGHESDEKANKQNGQSQIEVAETNRGSPLFDQFENDDDQSDEDVLSIFGNDDGDPLLEAEITENTQSKRQMQVPKWKNHTEKSNQVPKLILGPNLTKGTLVRLKSPRTISQPSTPTSSIIIRDFATQKVSVGNFTRQITNNLPLTPSSRDPREQKRLMLAENQNAMHSGQLSADLHMSQPSTSNAMQPPTALPPRKSVKERLGRIGTNGPVSRKINTDKEKRIIPDLMSVNPFATPLNKPIENKMSKMPNLQAFLPRDEPQGETLPELEVDNIPISPKVPELPEILRVNIREALLLPDFYQSPECYRPVFGYLFEKVCRPFMNDDCKLNPNQCEFDHRLPDVESFGNSIEKMLTDDIVETYKTFMLRIPKLFDTYFQVLATYFAKKKRCDVLKQMIIDCNARFKQHFFPHIVKCFMEMGNSYPKALAELIQTMKIRTVKTSHEIVKMILDGRNTNIKSFVKTLYAISKQKAYKYSIDHANRLLRIFDGTKNQVLAMVIFEILEDSNMAKLLDEEYLKKFAEYANTNKAIVRSENGLID